MKEYIEKLLKEQREICANEALLKLYAGKNNHHTYPTRTEVNVLTSGLTDETFIEVDSDSILNAPSPVIDIVSKPIWVKASERLPKRDGTYQVKRAHSDTIEYAEFSGGFTNYHGYKVVEWLDETAQQAPDHIADVGKMVQGYNEQHKGWAALFKDEDEYTQYLKWRQQL